MVMDIAEQTARLMFPEELRIPGNAGYQLWCMAQERRFHEQGPARLNPIIAWAVAANGGRYIACARGR
jgi:hypothetical protein